MLKINLKRESSGSRKAVSKQKRHAAGNTTGDELSETQVADNSSTQINNYSTLDYKAATEGEEED